jgi:dihydroneopterin aldolase
MRGGAEHQIHIEQLEVFAHVGVPRAERAKPQRLALNISFWPVADLRDLHDAVKRTVDYSALCQEIKRFVAEQSPRLIETLANQIAAHLLRKFAIRKVSVEILKFVPIDAKYASVTVTRCASLD